MMMREIYNTEEVEVVMMSVVEGMPLMIDVVGEPWTVMNGGDES